MSGSSLSLADPTGGSLTLGAPALGDITQAAPQAPFDDATMKNLQAQAQHDEILRHPMDTSTGLPAASMRSLLATESRMDNKQNLLEQALKSHFGVDVDVVPWGKDNLVYKNPSTGRWTLAEPSFLRAPLQAVSSLEPDAAEIGGAGLGAAIGGLAGTAVEPGAGTMAGGLIGAGTVATAAREANKAYLQKLSGVQDPRSFDQVMGDINWTTGTNMVGQALLPLLGKAFDAITPSFRGSRPDPSALVAADARGLAPPQTSAEAVQRAQGALNERYGTDLKLSGGTQMQSPAATGFEGVTSQLPGSPMKAIWEQGIADTGNLADRLGMDIIGGGGAKPATGAVAPTVDKTALGDAMHEASQGLESTFKNTEDTLRGQVVNLNGGNKVPLGSVAALERTLQPVPGNVNVAARQAALERVQEVLGASDQGLANLDDLLKLRTNIGQDAYKAGLNTSDRTSGTNQYLQDLYDAINQDLRAPGGLNSSAASALSDHDAFVQAMRDPNSLNLGGMSLKDIAKMASKYPDAFAESVINGNSAAARNFDSFIATVRRSSNDPDAVPNLLGTLFRNMGKPTAAATGEAAASQFSPSVFATNWAGLPAPVKRAFESNLHPELYAAINDLATVTKGIQAGSKTYNWSETGRAVAIMNMINTVMSVGAHALTGGGVQGLPAAAATYGAIPQLPRAFQNPALIRWYTGMLHDAGAGRPGWLANAAARLGAVKLNPADEASVRKVLNSNAGAAP